MTDVEMLLRMQKQVAQIAEDLQTLEEIVIGFHKKMGILETAILMQAADIEKVAGIINQSGKLKSSCMEFDSDTEYHDFRRSVFGDEK